MARLSEVDVASAVLEEAGIDFEVVTGGGHFKVRWRNDAGRVFTYHASNSPSDHRAEANCRACVRRLVRQSHGIQ